MKLAYIANARIPTEKAHGLQISKMCESYSALGHKVHLIVPDRLNQHKKNPFAFYRIKKNFLITYVKIPVQIHPTSRYSHRVIEMQFIPGLRNLLRCNEFDAIITRDIFCVLFYGKRYRIYYEMHDFPERFHWLWKKALKKANGVIVTNSWKKEKVVSHFCVSNEKVIFAPNGFDPCLFNQNAYDDTITRDHLKLSKDDFVLCYTGSLKTMSMDKGISWLIEIMVDLPPQVKLLFVGGASEDIKEYKTHAVRLGVEEQIRFISRIPHYQMASYMALADVFVAPFPDTPHFRYYMSPIKLFEYMAAAKPVVASKLPSIVEILGDTGLLFEPNDKKQFVEFITLLSQDDRLREQMSAAALNRSSGFTWNKRAERIVSFIKSS